MNAGQNPSGQLTEIGHQLTEMILKEKSGGFASFCPELPVASQGETEAEASEMLAEAVACFLEGGGQPAWNAQKERKDMAEWYQEYEMNFVYDGALRRER